jgi:hypothetical protein
MKVWVVLVILFLAAFLLAPRVSGFLYDSGGNYNVVWPQAYNNWVNLDGYIDVPTGAMCKNKIMC